MSRGFRSARRLLLPVAAIAVFLGLTSAAQDAVRADTAWQLGRDDYACYEITGTFPRRYAGLTGAGLTDWRPGHPAFIPFFIAMTVPKTDGKPGRTVRLERTVGQLDAYRPFRLIGRHRLGRVTESSLEISGHFKLTRAKNAAKDDPRWLEIVSGAITTKATFDRKRGVITKADVKFTMRVKPLIQLDGSKKMRRIRRNHGYRLKEIIPSESLDARVDRHVDVLAQRILKGLNQPPKDESRYRKAYANGRAALLVLALRHARVPRKTPALKRLMDQLDRAEIHRVYAASLYLMAIDAMRGDKLTDRERQRVDQLTRKLVRAQRDGWNYLVSAEDVFPHRVKDVPDTSNTQFALLGLRAARRLGASVPPDVWHRALAYWKRVTTRENGFGYRDNRYPSYPTMTAGGLASLTIIEEALTTDAAADQANDRAALGETRALIAKGSKWLDAFYATRYAGRRLLPENYHRDYFAYYLYSLERWCDLRGLKTLGGRDWYREGACALLHDAYDDEWSSHPLAYEALSLLFLRRSTKPATVLGIR